MSAHEPLRPVPSDERRPPSDKPLTTHQSHHDDLGSDTSTKDQPAPHGGHGLMMIVCCIPMLVIAGILFAAGTAGGGIILVGLVCTAMMAAMMAAMRVPKH